MRIIYLGSGDIGVPVLQSLLSNPQHEVVGLVTQPDKPVGRHQTLTPTAIKAAALDYIAQKNKALPIFQPARLRKDEDTIAQLQALKPDLMVVFAYGQILPQVVLDIPSIACLNIHASLLPQYRGAAPIQASIANGDNESGLTIMHMDAGLDTGDILYQEKIPLHHRETGGSLHDQFAILAPSVLETALTQLGQTRHPQQNDLATLAPKLSKQSGQIDWTLSAHPLDCHIRAMNPWPGAFTWWHLDHPHHGSDKMKLLFKIYSALPISRAEGGKPGEVLRVTGRGILVSTGTKKEDGGLLLREVQLEGKKRMHIQEFLRGHPITPGTALG